MVMMMTATATAAFAVASTHALILAVSHGLLNSQPPLFAAAFMPSFPFTK
jgi:hypothetical protein